MTYRLVPVSCGVLVLTALRFTAVNATPTGSATAAADARPCDIFAAGSTPCVAAHSLVRALFATFDGPLYRVKRASDNTTAMIGVDTPGGYADAAVQDRFCKGSDCIVDMIMDQTTNENHLLVGVGGDVATGPGGRAAPDFGLNASRLPITLQGHKIYGAYVEPGTQARARAHAHAHAHAHTHTRTRTRAHAHAHAHTQVWDIARTTQTTSPVQGWRRGTNPRLSTWWQAARTSTALVVSTM